MMPTLLWSSPEQLPTLAADELQLWRISLDQALSPDPSQRAAALPPFARLLDDSERARAERYRVPLPREQFVVARACLRALLGHALEVSPRSVKLIEGPHGKPALDEPRPLMFNVAHSRGLILLALRRSGDVGVDVEFVDTTLEAIEIARSTFTAREAMMIESAPTREEKMLAFYRCWTRKEAVTKADGRGLTLPLASFEVPAWESGRQSPDVEVAIPAAESSSGQKINRTFKLRDLNVGENFSAAVAFGLPSCTLTGYDFPLRTIAGTIL